jgi:hypothetical protein
MGAVFLLAKAPISPLSLHHRTNVRKGIALGSVPLDDEPRLAGWIFAIGIFSVPIGSERGQVVAKAFGYFYGFAFSFWGF